MRALPGVRNHGMPIMRRVRYTPGSQQALRAKLVDRLRGLNDETLVELYRSASTSRYLKNLVACEAGRRIEKHALDQLPKLPGPVITHEEMTQYEREHNKIFHHHNARSQKRAEQRAAARSAKHDRAGG